MRAHGHLVVIMLRDARAGVTVRWKLSQMTSSTCRTNPQHNETIDVFYIKTDDSRNNTTKNSNSSRNVFQFVIQLLTRQGWPARDDLRKLHFRQQLLHQPCRLFKSHSTYGSNTAHCLRELSQRFLLATHGTTFRAVIQKERQWPVMHCSLWQIWTVIYSHATCANRVVASHV